MFYIETPEYSGPAIPIRPMERTEAGLVWLVRLGYDALSPHGYYTLPAMSEMVITSEAQKYWREKVR